MLAFFEQVYEVVRAVPAGYVTTYGAIAKKLGTRDARRVGHALHANPNGDITPCHRVIFSDGRLANGYAFGGPDEQMRKLQLEGISFDKEGKVNLTLHLYHF